MPSISVVIPTYNEEKYIGLLLRDLNAQTALPKKIIVADCFSEDKTLNVAKTFKSRIPVEILQSNIRSAGGARNVGARAAETDYLLFIDADIRIPKNFVEEINKSLRTQSPDFLTPKYRTDDNATLLDHFMIRGVNWKMNKDIQKRGGVFGIGGVMCVRRSLHERVGGFKESIQTYEDVEYVKALADQRISAVYRPDLEVIVSSRRTLKDGKTVVFLRFVSEDSIISKRAIQPLLRKLGKEKKYGHYDK